MKLMSITSRFTVSLVLSVALVLSSFGMNEVAVAGVSNTSGNSGEYTALTQKRIANKVIGANSSTSIKFAGVAGIPSTNDITSVVYNLTAVSPSAGTYLTAYPSGTTRPGTSSLNTAPGTYAIANQITTKVGANGRVSIYNSSGTVRVIVDAIAIYESDGGFNLNNTAGGRYISLPTSIRAHSFSIPSNSSSAKKSFKNIRTSTTHRIAAVDMNLTATSGTSNYGWVVADGCCTHGISSLNYRPGVSIANQISPTVEQNSGNYNVTFNKSNSNRSVPLIADVSGYFLR